MLDIGDLLPDTHLHLHQYLQGGPLLVLFYTEAGTPLCTQQLCAVRDDFPLLTELHANAVAISSDPPDAVARFQTAQQFPFPLLSDPHLEAAREFGVVDEAARRAQRAAFAADRDGLLTLALPFYQPNNLHHYQQLFSAFGMEL